MKSGPRLPQLEKALTQKRRPNTAINKKIKKQKTKNSVVGMKQMQLHDMSNSLPPLLTADWTPSSVEILELLLSVN